MAQRLTAAAGLVVLALSGTAMAAAPAGVCRFAPAGGPASISNALERLVALTTDRRGIGGTGVVAQRDARPEERGLGGTGIIGVVTGFGSICVNGLEVEMAAGTAVTIEGLPASQGDIRLGQLVAVEAYADGPGLTAARVNVAIAVAGPVSEVAADRSRLTVAGQSVLATGFGGSADIRTVSPGDWVVVSGLRRADDSIAGSSIVKLPERGREVFVSGTARTNTGASEIGSLVVAAPLTAGDTATVRGPLTGNVLEARAVNVTTGSPFSRPMGNVSVQAYGQNLSTELRRLGIAPPAAAPGDSAVPVQVDGSFAAGAFVPRRMEAPPPPTDGAIPVERPAQTAPNPSQPVTLPPAIGRPGPNTPPPQRGLERPPLPPEISRPERPAPPQRPERTPPPDRPTRPEPPPRPL